MFVISGGNIDDPNAWMTYPQSNATDGIHDPGQAWNALGDLLWTLKHAPRPDIAAWAAIGAHLELAETWEGIVAMQALTRAIDLSVVLKIV